MPIERRNPGELHETPGYHHVTIVTGGRTVHLAGQVPLARDASLVGAGDVLAQADQVAANALTALASVGLSPGDVVRTVIYVVSDETTVLGEVWRRLNESPMAAA